ncbi:hypothetical protein KJ359_009688 [Pestalotiopsis sp. 9143b]|nr:hypothetical protein KJ359_009688 [Pestalotiopsis sp. 9143b]
MDTLQKTYSNFSSGLNDHDLDKILRNTDAVMAVPVTKLLAQVGIDSSRTEPFHLLDNACGTGAVVAQLQRIVGSDVLGKSKILCGDINQPHLDILQRRMSKNDWVNTEVATIDAQDSKLPSKSFSHVTISLGLHVIPQPDLVLKDTTRILQPGGVLAFNTMSKDNAGWVPDVRSAFATLPFDTAMPDPLPMTTNGHAEWADPERIEQKLAEHGFQNIRVETIQHIQHIESAEHFAEIFAMMISWMVDTYWTPEQKEEHQGSLKKRVEEHLKEKHASKGWDLTWTMILATCQTRQD